MEAGWLGTGDPRNSTVGFPFASCVPDLEAKSWLQDTPVGIDKPHKPAEAALSGKGPGRGSLGGQKALTVAALLQPSHGNTCPTDPWPPAGRTLGSTPKT